MAKILHTVMVCSLLLLQVQESKQSESYRFGTKTAYRHLDNGTSASNSSAPSYPEGCRPVHLSMVLRHGSRYPSKGDMRDIGSLLTKLKGIINPSLNITLDEPRKWSDAEPKELTSVGENEQYNIAKRFRDRFPGVFEKNYWNKYYKFVSSDKPRTARSAMSFAYGLFETRGPAALSKFQPVAITISGPKENDKLLLPYDACPKYKTDVTERGLGEVKKFKEGPEIRNLTKRLEERLDTSLTFDYVEAIFKLCVFGVMNREDKSWCALLEDEDMKIMEYQGDLENYYEHSYGNELSYKIICPLLSDIYQNLKDVAAGKSDLRGVFRFTSSGTLISLLTMLGLLKDATPLKADNYRQKGQRNFRSETVPMSGNIAVVLYSCNSTEMAGKPDHKLQVLVNETPFALPCCHGNVTCDLDEFLTCFKDAVDSCNFDAMCSLPTTGKPTVAALAPIFHSKLELTLISFVFTLFVII